MNDTLTSALTFGLTAAEAAVWLSAEYIEDPLTPKINSIISTRILAARDELRVEFLTVAREHKATCVRLLDDGFGGRAPIEIAHFEVTP